MQHVGVSHRDTSRFNSYSVKSGNFLAYSSSIYLFQHLYNKTWIHLKNVCHLKGDDLLLDSGVDVNVFIIRVLAINMDTFLEYQLDTSRADTMTKMYAGIKSTGFSAFLKN